MWYYSSANKEGGLGFRSLRAILKSFRIKAVGNILTSNNMWLSIMKTWHLRNQFARNATLKTFATKICRGIWKYLAQLVDLSTSPNLFLSLHLHHLYLPAPSHLLLWFQPGAQVISTLVSYHPLFSTFLRSGYVVGPPYQ